MKKNILVSISLLSLFSAFSFSEEPKPLYNIEVTVVENDDASKVTHVLRAKAHDGSVLTSKNIESNLFTKSENKDTSWWHSFVWWEPEKIQVYSTINQGLEFSTHLKNNGESLTVSLSTNYSRLKSIESKSYGDLTIQSPNIVEASYTGKFLMNYPSNEKSCQVFYVQDSMNQSICVSLAS
jgi:hypothetical protein